MFNVKVFDVYMYIVYVFVFGCDNIFYIMLVFLLCWGFEVVYLWLWSIVMLFGIVILELVLILVLVFIFMFEVDIFFIVGFIILCLWRNKRLVYYMICFFIWCCYSIVFFFCEFLVKYFFNVRISM